MSESNNSEKGRITRRKFLAGTSILGAAVSLPSFATEGFPVLTIPTGSPESVAADEAHWRRISSYYPFKKDITNLENGYFGMMPTPIEKTYQDFMSSVNSQNSYYGRAQFYTDYRSYRQRTADQLGASNKEVTFTRGATEALQNLIANYNLLKPGDSVMYGDLDYGGMQEMFDWLVDRRGVNVVRFDFPEPASKQSILAMYERLFDENPKLRLLILTHMNNRTGLIIPVAEIAAMARARNIDVILDAAHSFGHIDFKVTDLGVDFIGLNFHKWMGGPLGVGALYIKESRLKDIDPCFNNGMFPGNNIMTRASSGTSNFAGFNMIPPVLDFHNALGPLHKQARLRFLRDRWVNAVKDLKNLEVLTPDDPEMYCGITSFRIKGRTSAKENKAIVHKLLETYRIAVVHRDGVAKGDCVRVTPGMYTLAEDMDRFAAALREIVPA
jgi:selenocysteine lyase/cysteine desulfurase